MVLFIDKLPALTANKEHVWVFFFFFILTKIFLMNTLFLKGFFSPFLFVCLFVVNVVVKSLKCYCYSFNFCTWMGECSSVISDA